MKLLISYRVLSYARVSSTKDLLNRQTYQGIFCVSTLSPHTHVIEMLVLFCFCPSALQLDGSLPSSFLFCYLLSYLGFRLVLSCRLSVGPSPGHIIGLIVPANSNLVPSGLGLRPERMLVVVPVSFLFLSFSCLFALLWHLLFRVYVFTHGYVPGIIWMQVIRDGVPQLVSTFLLRAGNAVHVVCFTFFCEHRLELREMI